MTRLLYLDLDGVLNTSADRHPNGYSPLNRELVYRLNHLLANGQMSLVLSSAWRYLIASDQMNPQGLEVLLMTHGLDCHQRIAGITATDESTAEGMFKGVRTGQAFWDWLKEHGAAVRARQIRSHVITACRAAGGPEHFAYAVVDDMAMDVPRLVQVPPGDGIQGEHIGQLHAWLARNVTEDEMRELYGLA